MVSNYDNYYVVISVTALQLLLSQVATISIQTIKYLLITSLFAILEAYLAGVYFGFRSIKWLGMLSLPSNVMLVNRWFSTSIFSSQERN